MIRCGSPCPTELRDVPIGSSEIVSVPVSDPQRAERSYRQVL